MHILIDRHIMKSISLILFLFVFPLFSPAQYVSDWKKHTEKGYSLYYTASDEPAMESVVNFFGGSYLHPFDVYIFPGRKMMDSVWRKDWGLPNFKSECWMVASGIGQKIDILSPARWKAESCEHDVDDQTETQHLITHELFHVYHGQINASHDFSDVDGIDWFVEGLATYGSGQCDQARVAAVKKGIADHTIPLNIEKFWTGNMKYGLSGTLVLYIDKIYGRDKLKSLLHYNKKSQILEALAVEESALLDGWKNYLIKIN